ncbi:uncharacterized protein DUF4091 [Kribbella amoyensis]|uniref:Uncharacterized protein DUF4091 n=1 Tax=Kribbella amoyensis TaxID=996641 RepID=A0A561B8U2_9ACTN|nr:DUF4091 domain-containing protein [Kribbella amoyensis]TWD75273.1 uncharacterized protein DUF4091 [Kribbella amoyensis]
MRGPLRLLVTAVLLALFVPSLVALPAAAADDMVLADFESADALKGATILVPGLDQATVTDTFASTGRSAMALDLGPMKSKQGQVFPRVWLNVGSTLPDVDWTQWQYLHVGVANASAEPATLYLVVFDKAGKYVQRSIAAQPFAYHVFQLKVSDIAAAGVNLADLAKVQLSSERSVNPKRLLADDLRLTNTATDIPAEVARVAPKLIGSMNLNGLHADAAQALEQVRRGIKPGPLGPDQHLKKQAASIRTELDALKTRIGAVGNDADEARAIWFAVRDVGWEVKRLASLVSARKAQPAAPVGLGFADAMTRVYPRDLPCDCSFAKPTVDAVRGEHEGLQLVAIPYGAALTDVGVKVRALRPGITVDAHPVLSFDMKPPVRQHPATPTAFRPSNYTGWTPDAIQTGYDTVDTEAGDLQAFWVSIETSQATRPGVYPVVLELRAAGLPPQLTRFDVKVHDTTIARQSGLRTAIGHDPKAYAEPYGVTDPAEVRRLVDEEYDFLDRYLLQGDNIYRKVYETAPPSVESLRKIEARPGGLRQFNIWYFDPRVFDRTKPDTWAAQADELFDLIQPYVEQYRAAGLLDKGYLYCCDETRAEHTELVKFVLTRFKARFPGVKVLTTIIDDQMGRQSGLDKLIDWWVRDVPWFEPDVIAERHAAGREAWWYLHAGNRNPTPNVFVNYDPGQLRTLLGPMAHQAGVDGFLYYRVDRWYGHPLLDDDPTTSWDPQTWNDLAGDGSLLYPGPDGPVPSIRLENIRDGLEDYNLLDTLQQAIDTAPPATDPRLIAEAKRLLSGKDVVTSNYEYVQEPAKYRTWRANVLTTLDRLR